MTTALRTIRGIMETGEVTVGGKPLSLAHSQRYRNHSPTGFNWGYEGSGPAQLALALLLEYCSAVDALRNYQDFKRERIAVLPQENFIMDETEVIKWLVDRGVGVKYAR